MREAAPRGVWMCRHTEKGHEGGDSDSQLATSALGFACLSLLDAGTGLGLLILSNVPNTTLRNWL